MILKRLISFNFVLKGVQLLYFISVALGGLALIRFSFKFIPQILSSLVNKF